MDKQARLPPALAALHNFIRKHDPDDMADFDNDIDDPQPGTRVERPAAADEGELSAGPTGVVERRESNDRRNEIAREMWIQYQAELSRRGRNIEE
jgi:hypothetical protein